MKLSNRITTLIAVAAVLLLVVAGREPSRGDNRKPNPRFEVLWQGEIRDSTTDVANWAVPRGIAVLHDRESGVEFVCARPTGSVFGSLPLSCFPTGRTWK